MTTPYTYSGSFGWAGGGKSGATVDLWAKSRFVLPPAENTAPPSGTPDAGPVTTGIDFGSPGAFTIANIPTVEDYYVRVVYGGNTYWGAVPAGSIQGVGAGSLSSISSPDGTLSVINPDGPAVELDIATSVALPGSPTTTTQSPGDNSTKIATTAFVQANASGTIAPTLANEQFVRNQPSNMMTAPTAFVPMNYQPITNIGSWYVTDGTNSDGMVSALPASLSLWANVLDQGAFPTQGYPTLQLINTGAIGFGPGSTTAQDTFLTRTAANTLQVGDGTATHSSVRLVTNAAVNVGVYGNTADTQALVALGTSFGAGAIAFGAGGTTAPDVLMSRTTTGTAQVTGIFAVADGTAAHGLFKVSSNPSEAQVFANSADTQPILALGSVLGAPSIGMGPGGTTATDVLINRSNTGGLSHTATAYSFQDATAAHGEVAFALNAPMIEVFANSADTQPLVSMGSALGNGAVGWGAGGTTAQDLLMFRSGAAALQLTGSTFSVQDATASDGQVRLGVGAARVHLRANSGDTQPAAALSTTGLSVGAGGSSATDISILRTGALAFGVTASTFAMTDGTAGDGKINLGLASGAAAISIYGNSGDANPMVSLGPVISAGAIGLGPGGSTAADVLLRRSGTAALTITGTVAFSNGTILSNTNVTVTSNAGTVPVTTSNAKFTNSSAATMAITIATSGATDGQVLTVRVYDFSAVSQTIGWTNTENSSASVPTTSNGSTTLPKTVTFMYNSASSKWRCILSV